MKSIASLLFVLGISALGCATAETQGMLNSRMGQMTYEEALQRFGAPSQCADAGATKTCTWIYGSGGAVYVPVGNVVAAVPTQAPTARLTFTNDRLSYWQLWGNWR